MTTPQTAPTPNWVQIDAELAARQERLTSLAMMKGDESEIGIAAHLAEIRLTNEMIARSQEARAFSKRKRNRWKLWFGGFAGLYALSILSDILGMS
jgi:hypothetical protein